MCNLYSVTKGQSAIRDLFDAMDDRSGNLPSMPAIFPDYSAPIVRNTSDGGRELTRARWGMPSPVFALKGKKVDREDLNGYLMYPKVFLDYMGRHRTYGPVRTLPTKTFFYGMEPAEEISAEIDPGKTLEIRLQAVGETGEDGEVKVFFELNGQPRVIRVPDRKAAASSAARPKAELGNDKHIGAPMPGVVATVAVKPGDKVKLSLKRKGKAKGKTSFGSTVKADGSGKISKKIKLKKAATGTWTRLGRGTGAT